MNLFTVYAKLSYFLKDFWLFLSLDIIFFFLFIFGLFFLFRSGIGERKKKLAMVCLAMLCFTVFIFTGFEAYFRYRYDESDSLGFLKVSSRWFARHVVYNTYQYRDRDFVTEKKPGVTRIGIVGDSMTYGYGIKNPEDRFSNLLEKKLNDSGRKVEVYNLGKSGYDTWNEIIEFKRVQQLNFDIIVWQYYLNDAEPQNSRGSTVLLKEEQQGKLAQQITSFSYFLDYIYWRLVARYETTFTQLRQADIDSYHDKKNFAYHKTKVKEFADLLKEHDRKVVVLLIPFIKFLPDNPIADMYPQIKGMFHDNDLPVVDMYTDLKTKQAKDVLVSRFDYHPNETVQKMIANDLYATLAPMIPASKK